jgi:hypothetical protein
VSSRLLLKQKNKPVQVVFQMDFGTKSDCELLVDTVEVGSTTAICPRIQKVEGFDAIPFQNRSLNAVIAFADDTA